MLDRSRSRDRSKAGGAFSPAGLFVSGAQGAWYDPSDFSTLFQDAAGTTPVTAVEQPVRLMLDRSRGLVLGGELVSNPGPFTNTTGWVAQTGVVLATSGGNLTVDFSGASGNARTAVSITCFVGRAYSVTLRGNRYAGTSGNWRVLAGPNSGLTSAIASSNTSSSTETDVDLHVVFVATQTTMWVGPSNSTISGGMLLKSVSVRELPGNHATAPNDASRPVLRARYNLLTRSEEFDVSPWSPDNSGAGSSNPVVTANYGTAPNGTTTADRIQFTRGATGFSRIQQGVVVPAATYTYSVWLRNTSGSGASVSLRLDATDGAMITLTEAWQRVSLTASYAGGTLNSQILIWSSISGSPLTADILAWGAQLLTAADQTSTGGAYQRIAAATDYDTSNPVWRPYLAFDGSDDSFSTSSIDFSGTDEVTVFAGLTKLSDAAIGLVAELSASSLSNPGFYLAAPIASGASGNFAFFSSGSIAPSTPATSSTILAPATRVLTGQSDISTDSQTLRINGAADGSSAQDQGTGNYSNAALFIGRRNNTSFPFNGRLTSLIVLGRTATAAEISATEQWIAGKTGVTI